LIFSGENSSFEIESDTMEISTDFSNKLRIGITEFEVDLETELIEMILNESIKSITLTFQKTSTTFNLLNQLLLQSQVEID